MPLQQQPVTVYLATLNACLPQSWQKFYLPVGPCRILEHPVGSYPKHLIKINSENAFKREK